MTGVQTCALPICARQLRVTLQLALQARQQVLVPERRQPHRDRVDEDDFVAGARELAHQVGLGVWMVIPPVFTAKADYRAIEQHDFRDFTGLERSPWGNLNNAEGVR